MRDTPELEQPDARRQLVEKAGALLARREHSACELAEKLHKWGPPELVQQVIRELQHAGLQSDQRFAEMLCRARVNSGKGPCRIRLELVGHDIAAASIEAAMTPYAEQWSELAEQARAGKFGAPAATYKDWARQARFLQQRGFDNEHIRDFGR